MASSVAGLALNAGTYAVLTTLTGFFDRHRMLALVLGVGVGGLVNFALATGYVYRRRVADRNRTGPTTHGRTTENGRRRPPSGPGMKTFDWSSAGRLGT